MQEVTMNHVIKHHFNAWGYQTFKYLVYTALAVNVYLFFSEEWAASKVIFAQGVNLNSIIEAFSSTIDTASWLVLLILFELETYVIDDEKLVGSTKLALHTVRGLCYIIILYAFYGYLTKIGLLSQFNLLEITDLCSFEKGWKYMETLNVYNEITLETCRTISATNTEFYLHGNYPVVASLTSLNDVKMLAWVDVINSGAWISVVLMLEIDVRVKLKNITGGLWKKYSPFVKVTVYGVLLICAVYWGVTGNFIEFWDAFLWLVAFVLIEMNMFEWQKEINQKKADQKTQP